MRLRRLVPAAALILALLAPARAHAEKEWYGHHVLAADTGGLWIFCAGAATGRPAVMIAGAGVLVLGGPAVHVAHGNYGRAGISLALRVGPTALGFGAGLAREVSPSWRGVVRGAFTPFLIGAMGYVVGAIVDIAVVAREDDGAPAARVLSVGGRF
jgi:hypothetical protein